MAMTNEEIDAEIERLTALKEQNNKAQTNESNKPADGIYNPADYISQITSKMNGASYTDEQGNKKSYGYGDKFSKNLDVAKNAGRRTGFEQDKDGTPLPETAYEWITQQLNEARARGPVSKYTLRAIENGAKVRYNVPSNFDISGKGWFGNTDAAMARAMNNMPYNGKSQQTQPTQTPKPAQTSQTQSTQNQQTQGTQGTQNQQTQGTQGTQGTQNQQTQGTQNQQTQGTQNQQTQGTQNQQTQGTQGTSDISPKVKIDNERTAAYKRIKAKQASYADLALFKNYTEEQLKKIGFRPISIKAIKDTANQTQQVDDDKQFMQQYKQYTQQLSGSQPRDPAALKAMQESDAYKFVTDQANKDRYNKLTKAQEDNKKANKNAKKIEKLKQQLDVHKKIMAENPDRPDIQSAQQTHIDSITKDIQKLGGSVE